MQPHQNPATRPMYVYLLVLTFAQASALLGWTALYTNFAVEVAGLTGEQNGIVHAVREVPGLFSVAVLLLFYVMSEIAVTSVSIIICGLGVVATGFFPSFEGILLCTFILSTGFHFFEATNQSLTLQYFSLSEAPVVIGRLRAATAAGSFLMGLAILLLAGAFEFRWLFILAGSVSVAAGIWAVFQKPGVQGLPPQRKGMVLKAKYWLFYLLTGLSGARRVIVSVFAVFLMVEHFGLSLREMSLLLLGGHLINWIVNPYIGRIINAYGEKRLLLIKYLCIIGLCLGYVFCPHAWMAAALYICDQLLFCFTISIRTFFQKIADTEDIAPSMAVGVTVNHIAAVAVPVAGGMLWMLDYRIPFAMGAVFGLLSLLSALFIPAHPGDGVKER